ncbi:MAG: DUF433 domain-containing protein [Chloroflexota bacterium]|nr:DUF433 domain-containing protein [Chloroflexota bacterium]
MATMTEVRGAGSPDFDPTQGFYSRSTAARLARVPQRTVTLWDRHGIIPPIVQWVNEQGKEIPGYTFEGLVYLRLIRMLREMKKPFPLRKVVETVTYLRTIYGPPSPRWVEAKIVSDGKNLWVQHPVIAVASRAGQMPLKEFFRAELGRMAQRQDALLIPLDFMRWVEIKPALRNGMPVIKGTGIETSIIHAAFNQGLTVPNIKSRYPYLSPPQISHSERFEQFLDAQEALAP